MGIGPAAEREGERLGALAGRPPVGKISLLVCRAGPCWCGILLDDVEETMRPLPCEPLAGGPGIVSGVSVIRGDLVPVVEIGRLLGTGPSPAGRYVTIRVGSRRVALAVDSVLGVREIACDTLSGLPPLLGGADSDAIAALAVRDAEFLVILQAARLVPEPVWALLEDLEPA